MHGRRNDISEKRGRPKEDRVNRDRIGEGHAVELCENV